MEADCARFPAGDSPRSLDLQDGALIFSVFVPGKEFCSVHRSLKLRTPGTSGHKPEVRIRGQREIKTQLEECHRQWTRKQRPSDGLLSKQSLPQSWKMKTNKV